MSDLKIGNLIFKKKAIGLIALCLFLNGTIIGATAAFNESHSEGIAITLLFLGMFLPYLLLAKAIRQNIIELN